MIALRRCAPAVTATAVALVATGCVATSTRPSRESIPELTEVRFFPQTAYDCGPAALATILTSAGVTTTPTALVDEVYIEGRKGSLQAELMATTRRFERIPLLLPTSLEALLDVVASGRPALVLLNLGLERMPVWHYAVVVGFDAVGNRIILRSGEEPRLRERVARFERQWERAGRWAFVAARPGDIPAGIGADEYLRAVGDAEAYLSRGAVATAYDASLDRWPGHPSALFVAANRRFAAEELSDAARLYRRLLALRPDDAAARNNLALALLDQGCHTEALREARRALADASIAAFRVEIEDTLRQIEAAPLAAADGASCAAG
jgi:tetratricopeptide (TPR) repeat protein